MKVHEYREMMRYLTRKPLSEREVELAYTDHMQKLNTPSPMPAASGENFTNEERVEFAKAGLASNEPVKAGELLSYLKKYNIDIHPGNMARAAQLYGIESPSSGKYILPTEAQIPIIKEQLTKNIKSGTTIEGKKSFEERNKLVKELVASEKYNPTEIKDIIQKKYNLDMGNTIQKEINEARKKGKIIPSAREGETSTNTQKLLYDLNLLNENKKIKSILSNPKLNFEKDYLKMVNEVKDTLKINDSKANYRLARLLEAYSQGEIPSNKNIIDNSNKVTGSIYANRPFGSLGSVLRRKLQVEPGVASQIGEDPNYFIKSRKEISRKLPEGYSTDEIKGLASSFENLTGRYSVFAQGIKGDINLNKGRTIDKLINTVEKQLQNLDTREVDYLDKREKIKNKYNERIEEFANKYNKDLKKGELPVRGFKLSFDSPKNSLTRYNELKKINPDLIEGVEDIYSKYNYSFEVPADVKTIPEVKDYVKSSKGQASMEQRAKAGDERIYFEELKPTAVPKLYETIRSGAQKYLPGAPLRVGAATADYLMQNYLFNMPAADAAIAASTWIVKNPQAADAMGKTISAALQGKATVEDARDFIDTLVKNTSFEDLIVPPALQKPKTNLPVVEQKESLPKEKEETPSYSEFQFKKGGRVKLANGTDETYNPEIPSLGLSDPIDLLEQQLVNEKDSTRIGALLGLLEITKKERAAKEKARQEEKAAQKAKGVRYKEDFPSEAAYFAETGKQLLTNPKYTLGSLGKGVVQGTEFLIGQPLQTLFSQTGKNFEFYEPVLTEKLGIDKFVEENTPKDVTTGTLLGGEALKIAGEFADPFLLYGIGKSALKSMKPKPPTTAADETIDSTRRDILKTGAVMGTGAMLYPTAKKLGMFDNIAKTAAKKAPFVNIVRPLGATETQFPEWFPSLVNRLRKEGDMKPIYATKEVPLTKEEYLKLREKGTNKIYDEHLTRTQEYIDEFEKTGKPRYYQIKDTDDIIGYEYMDKNIPDVKAVEYNGEEMNVYFQNNYGQSVEIQYVAPGKKNKEGQFAVADARPEPGSGYDSAPDFEQVYVKDIDEVLGGSGEVEQYAKKTKARRSTKGAEEFEDNEMRALMEIDRLKDEGIIE